jgi:hypothetical protein
MGKINYGITCDAYSIKQKANALVKEKIFDLIAKAKGYTNTLYNNFSEINHEEKKAFETLKYLGYNQE